MELTRHTSRRLHEEHVTVLALLERLASHAQKEQVSLVPVVDELLDEATDLEIWNEYVN